MIRFELIRLFRSRASRNLILLFMLASFIIFLAGYTSIFSNNFSWQSYCDMADNMTIRSADKSYQRVKNVLEDFYDTGKIHQGVYTDNISKELKLYKEIESELEQVCNYENYRQNIMDDAKKVQSISLFQKSEFSVANAEKTYRDYETLGDIEVEFYKTYGVKRLFLNQDMLICILFIIIILVDLLFLRDIEENRTLLLHTIAGGRKQLGVAKIWFGAILIIASYTIIFAMRIATIAITYGIPRVPIQSVYGYSSCIFKIDTYEAMGLFAAYQLLIILALYMLGIFLALIVKNNGIFYSICLAFGILSEILYRVIQPYSNLAILQRCNIFYLLNPREALFGYRNVEIGGRVFLGWIVNVTLCISILLIAGFMDYTLYKNVVRARHWVSKSDISYYTERLWHRILGRRCILGAELRKCFLYSKGILIIVGLIIMIAYIYRPASTRLYTDEEIYYKQYVTMLQGKYSLEKMDYLYDELMTAETQKKAGIEKTISYGQYLADKSGTEFVYDRAYLILMGLGSGKNSFLEYRILSVLVSVILTLMILDIDEKTKMRQLIIPTATGFRRLVLAKRQAVFISCLLVFAIVYIPWILSVLASYTDISWSVGASSIESLSWCGQIPVGIVIAIFFLLHLLGLILVSKLTEILYRWLEKVIPAASISCMVGLGICLILRG